MQGWIKLHRQIMDHPFYLEERVFSKHEAWEYLLLSTNHADNKALIDGKMIMVERGSFVTSIRKLQERWKWSNTKVLQFLELLESEGMIQKKSDTKKTLISIDKYDCYQGYGEEKRHENDAETMQKHTNKNVKNEKNKKAYAENVHLSEKEYLNLCEKYGQEMTDRSIEYLSLYKVEKSYKTKSDNLTIQRWVMEAVKEKSKSRYRDTEKKVVQIPYVPTEEDRRRVAQVYASQ